MPYFLAGFMQQHDGIDLSVDVTHRQKVVDNLANNEVDFALVSILPQQLPLPIHHLALMPNKLYVVGRSLPEGGG